MRKLWFLIKWSPVLAMIAAVAGYIFIQNHAKARGPLQGEKTFIVDKGMSFRQITAKLADENIIPNRYLFKAYVVLNNKEAMFKAGEYLFEPGTSPRDVVALLADGKAVSRNVTIPEGLLTEDILKRVAKAPYLKGDVPHDVGEGELLPETYAYLRGDSRAKIVNIMRKGMTKTLNELWEKREAGLPLKSKREALILASIVEKETGVGAERSQVAGVFINRLNRGMKLQTDPTVIYGMYKQNGKYDRTIRKSHLANKNPYNTYIIDGLPPTPIANPGRAAIEAVLNPNEHDYLYFVATGGGGHHFSKTYAEHERYVAKYRAWERAQKAN